MSVINKMLRDLDQRETARLAPLPATSATTGLAQGTRVVLQAPGRGQRTAFAGQKLLIAGLVLVLLAVALWAWLAAPPPSKPEDRTGALPMQAQTAQQGAAVGPAPLMAAQIQAAPPASIKKPSASAAVVPAPLPAASKPKGQLPAPTPVLATAVTRGEAPIAAMVAKVQAAAPLVSGPAPVAAVLPATSVANSGVAAGSALAPISPGMEALAQSQLLWTSGANEAAIDLLDQALSAAERGAPSAATPTTVAALARELARMLLAQGRVNQALERLTQLEPLLGGVADIWATRGNAAQRLGRHQESVNAYLTALKLRPDEPRWMLGAAVSLAAQGQTTSAAEYAEQARQAGVLRPEVATYLRQLGVSLR